MVLSGPHLCTLWKSQEKGRKCFLCLYFCCFEKAEYPPKASGVPRGRVKKIPQSCSFRAPCHSGLTALYPTSARKFTLPLFLSVELVLPGADFSTLLPPLHLTTNQPWRQAPWVLLPSSSPHQGAIKKIQLSVVSVSLNSRLRYRLL